MNTARLREASAQASAMLPLVEAVDALGTRRVLSALVVAAEEGQA